MNHPPAQPEAVTASCRYYIAGSSHRGSAHGKPGRWYGMISIASLAWARVM